jgi:hypothetical protein
MGTAKFCLRVVHTEAPEGNRSGARNAEYNNTTYRVLGQITVPLVLGMPLAPTTAMGRTRG